MNDAPYPTDCSIITTFRCQMKCEMCGIWQNPTDPRREIRASELSFLPRLKIINITGGEPFLRADIGEFAELAIQKADVTVVSTSGWHVDRIVSFCRDFPRVGIRVSIEGLSQSNDRLRGRAGGFDRAVRLLTRLKEMGHKNIGFGMTVSNHNSADLLPLYRLSKALGFEFATATFHNSFYFHKTDNTITESDKVVDDFYALAEEQLKESTPKSWFRALFNLGLIRYIHGERRMLPCEAGEANFFVYPYGDVYPCNGLEERHWKESIGNIRGVNSFEELWFSERATRVRQMVRQCPKNCWMVGTAAPVMKKYLQKTGPWVLRSKLRSLKGDLLSREPKDLPYFDVGQDPCQGDLRVREWTKEVEVQTLPIKFVGDFDEDTELVSRNGES